MNIHRSAQVHDTRREQRKEATTRSGANRAPLRRQGATHQKGSKTKSPFCLVLKTYHLTGIHHKTCLKHSNFLNRKLCVQLLPTWNTMATNRRKNTIRQNELRQGSKHGNYNKRGKARHHNTQNQEKAVNLSSFTMSVLHKLMVLMM